MGSSRTSYPLVTTTILILLILSIASLAVCRMTISKGREAPAGFLPHMVAIKRADMPFPFCGGTLVSDRHVVTAAHCFKASAKEESTPSLQINAIPNLEVVLGRVSLATSDGISVGVDQVFIHTKFNPNNYDNDIAVLKLSKSVPFNNAIKPALFPKSNSDVKPLGTVTTISGWGFIDAQEKLIPKNLQYVNVPLIDGNECLKKNLFFNASIQLCAGLGNGQDSCTGDSGGPMSWWDSSAKQWYLQGVISFGGTPCGGQGVVGNYVKVASYLPWLKEQLAK